MSLPLAIKYRPQVFGDLIGQDLNAAVLSEVARSKNVPPGFLFSGPAGTGKTSAARILARELCGEDYIEVDAASHGGVDNVRGITDSLQYASTSNYRAVILDEAHNLTSAAFNALLKTLEEPPQGTVFILVTTEPHKIQKTVLDRLVEYEFRSVRGHDILGRLSEVCEKENISIDPALAQALVDRAGGSVRRALMSLEQVSMAKITTLAEFENMTGERDFSPALLEKMVASTYADVETFVDLVLQTISSPTLVVEQLTFLLRDLLVIRSGGNDKETSGWERRKELAWAVSQDQVFEALKVLWDCRTRLRKSGSPRADLALVTSFLFLIFNRTETTPEAEEIDVVSEEEFSQDEELSLSDMMR